jgi:hypothetical protein
VSLTLADAPERRNGDAPKRLFPRSSPYSGQLFLCSIFFFHCSCQILSTQSGMRRSVKLVLIIVC